MTVKETIEMFKGQYADIEVYENFNSKKAGFHTDRIKSSDDYSENDEVLEYELMDEDEYGNTILANTSNTPDFSEWYDNKEARILIIKIYKHK